LNRDMGWVSEDRRCIVTKSFRERSLVCGLALVCALPFVSNPASADYVNGMPFIECDTVEICTYEVAGTCYVWKPKECRWVIPRPPTVGRNIGNTGNTRFPGNTTKVPGASQSGGTTISSGQTIVTPPKTTSPLTGGILSATSNLQSGGSFAGGINRAKPR
jgi:hypothetical protein